MREIKASDKVHGKRRQISIEAARRKVNDGEQYFIRRHGGYFRPKGRGYTDDIAQAGVFSAGDARAYLDVNGLSVVPVRSMRKAVRVELAHAANRAELLQILLNTVIAPKDTEVPL